MSEPAESVAKAVSKKVAPGENVRLEEQAPPPPYEDLEGGRPSPLPTASTATRPTPPMINNVLIRFLTVVGYCSLIVLCTVYGYTYGHGYTLGDGSNALIDVLYSGVIGGTVLGIPFTRKGGIFDRYQNRWKLCNTHIACGRLRRGCLEFLWGTFLALLICWSALVVGFCIQRAPIVLVEHPNMMPLLEHMLFDWYASSTGVLALLSMTSMLGVWVLVKEPRISHSLEEDRFKLIVVGVLWTCFLTSMRGSITLIHLLVVLVLPKKLTDRFVLKSDKLRAADQANAGDTNVQ